jgi:aspartate beta-hydroxylase
MSHQTDHEHDLELRPPRRLADQVVADLEARFPVQELTRVRRFVQTLTGQAQPSFHLHQSTNIPPVHFPDLPCEPFFDTNVFEEAQELEEAFDLIRRESNQLLIRSVSPKQYESRGGPPNWPNWKKLVFYEHGPSGRVQQAFEQFPETGRLVDRLVPRYEDFLSIGFLIQDGNVKLSPHIDWFNLYVSLWLPIVVPDDCGIQVASERRELVVGKCIAFDNSFLHSSWNESDQPRIVFAIYRLTPRITRVEAMAFTYIRQTYGGQFSLGGASAPAH